MHTGSQSPARRRSLERRSQAAKRRSKKLIGVRDQLEPVKRRRAVGKGRQLIGKVSICVCWLWMGKGGSPGWSRGQQSKYHWCQWE
ncbi:unnamed protein product, partial [Staurois parvus]